MPSNKMSGYKSSSRNRTRARHWRETRQEGLLGSAPRNLHGRQQQGLLGGGPNSPAMAPVHRPNPWESGMMPGNHALPPAMARNQAVWGGNAPQPPSLLGTPDMMGGGGGAGLLGGVPQDATMMGINQLARMNSRKAKMALNIIDTVLAPQQGPPGPRYDGPFPYKMGHMDRGKMARGRGRDGNRPGGGGGSGGSPNDLRKWLKDKRGLTCPRPGARQFGSSSQHRSGGSSSASSSRKDRPESSRGSSPSKAADDKDAEAEEKCPVEALHCHVCNVDQFSSLSSFKHHLRSSTHEEMLSALYRKNSAVLDLLRQQSKIAAMQQTMAATVDDKEPKKSQCHKCICKVPGSLQKHIASVEHKLVNNFQIVNCCNVWFSSRPDYEQHKLGFRHLLTKYEEKQKKLSNEQKTDSTEDKEKADEDGGSSEDGSEWWSPADRALKRLHQTLQSSEHLTLASLSPYTGLSPVGESFVRCRASLECSACDERFDPASADVHCRSNAHYLNVLSALKAKDEANAQQASEKAPSDEMTASKDEASQIASNSSAANPESSATDDSIANDTTTKDEPNAKEGYGDKELNERGQASYSEELECQQGDQDDDVDDDDERMIYEGLHDEPQLLFDDDEEELNYDTSKLNDQNGASESENVQKETPEETSPVADSESVSPVKAEGNCVASSQEKDEEQQEPCKNEGQDVKEENTPHEQGNTVESGQDKDVQPPLLPDQQLVESVAGLPSTDSVQEKNGLNDSTVEVQKTKDALEEECQDVEDQDLQSSVPSETEPQGTRRSGRASRKRPAADDAAEEPRLAEPTPKRGRGRGRGRGGRK